MFRKVKFNLSFKKECIDLIEITHRSVLSVSKEKKVSKALLSRWLFLYQQKGIQGLYPKPTKSYSAKFKLEVLTHISKTGISLNEACVLFDIGSSGTISNWRGRYKALDLLGLQDKPKGKIGVMTKKPSKKKVTKPLTREEELLEENKYLRAEVDYLKKLEALIQAQKNKG